MREPRRFPLDPQESALLALGVVVAIWTMQRRAFSLCLESSLTTAILAAAIACSARQEANHSGLAADRWSRVRTFCCFPFMGWFYGWAVARIVPALGERMRDPILLAIDRAVFGETPSVAAARLAIPALIEPLSLCYVSFHIMIVSLLVWAFAGDAMRARRICQPVFLTFAIGFLGYITVPAVGPERAFPQLYASAIPVGALSGLNTRIINAGTALYDVFPSLHTAVTLCILRHDWRWNRRRFWFLLLPCSGILVSTIVLRYHYAIDLAAGALLAAAVSALTVEAPRSIRAGESLEHQVA